MEAHGYKVEPSDLDTAATDISHTKRAIDRHRTGLDQSTSKLLTLWTGEASQAWERTQDGWQTELAETLAAGAGLAAALRESADIYRDVDEAVGRAWSI